MSRKTLKVLGAGFALLDLLAYVPEDFLPSSVIGKKGGRLLLEPDPFLALLSKTETVTSVTSVPGGSTANLLSALAHTGIHTSFLARIGKDDRGFAYRKACEKQGCDSRSFKIDPLLPTGCCLCLVTPDGQRTMRVCAGAAGHFSAADITDADFEEVTHFHLEGYLLPNKDFVSQLLSMAKMHHCTVSMDFSSFEIVQSCRDVLNQVVRDSVDLVFCNEDEAFAFSRNKNPEETLQYLSTLCRTAVVTMGSKGALIRSGDQVTRVNSGTAKAMDTTGAGDLWQAGFLYGWLREKSDRVSGEFASAVANEVIQVTGARLPEDRWNFLLQRFSEIEQKFDPIERSLT